MNTLFRRCFVIDNIVPDTDWELFCYNSRYKKTNFVNLFYEKLYRNLELESYYSNNLHISIDGSGEKLYNAFISSDQGFRYKFSNSLVNSLYTRNSVVLFQDDIDIEFEKQVNLHTFSIFKC